MNATARPGPVPVFVDLSNVAKDALLGHSVEHASLARWERLKGVWLRDRGAASFTLIADASLPRALSAQDRANLERMVTAGAAVMVPDADMEVLRRAISHRSVALSNDQYVDHRRIVGLQDARLVGWVVRGPNVRLQDRSLDRLLSAVISARAHKQELKELGLAEGAPELGFRWYCRNNACPQDLVAVPHLVRGAARCPACDAFLDRGDAWDHPVWVKVLHGTAEITRFVLEDGEQVYVGRGTGPDVVTLKAPGQGADEPATLDDRHLELVNEAGRLLARDNGTARGCSLRRPGAGRLNRHSPPMPLMAARLTPVSAGTKIVLGRSKFVVQIAGQPGVG